MRLLAMIVFCISGLTQAQAADFVYGQGEVHFKIVGGDCWDFSNFVMLVENAGKRFIIFDEDKHLPAENIKFCGVKDGSLDFRGENHADVIFEMLKVYECMTGATADSSLISFHVNPRLVEDDHLVCHAATEPFTFKK